jgi:NAD-dependent dihydropyrimidine dehydrogenase PreA subunit
MRDDAMFIGIEVDDAIARDPEIARRLEEACPVDIFAGTEHGLEIVHDNVDECILCALCIEAAPAGAVKVHKLYSGEALTPAAR